MTRKKVVKEPEPFWTDMVSVWFQFCRDELQDTPTFDGSAPRDLKSIVKSLRDRTEKQGIAWTLIVATGRLYKFFQFAYKNSEWLQSNWQLNHINRNKESIFFNLRKSISKTPPTDPF